MSTLSHSKLLLLLATLSATALASGCGGQSNGDAASDNPFGPDGGSSTTAGNGRCDIGENALDAPAECPAEAGDGFCTHTENARTTPADCAALAGDGFCTHNENAATTPLDCPAVAGDGFCTHSENAATTPLDCPAVAGDGFCTHNENPSTTPLDCPASAGDGVCSAGENAANAPLDCRAVAGDGFCTHNENASTTPRDCPAVAGDGFCTHSETFDSAPADCPPPSFIYVGGNLEALTAVSATLVFSNLTINAPLILDGSPRTITMVADNITITSSGRIDFNPSPCSYPNAPDLTFIASGTVLIDGDIDLSGKNGTSTTPDATCNQCAGTNAGNLVIDADTIRLNGALTTIGGYGSSDRWITAGELFQVGCDGGDGGDIALNAGAHLELGTAYLRYYGGPGGHGNTYGSDGTRGIDGTLFWAGDTISVLEDEPNDTVSGAQRLYYTSMTLSGEVFSDDVSSTADIFVVVYPNGDEDTYEDLFSIEVASAGRVRFVLQAADPTVDLDLTLFNPSTSAFVANVSDPGPNATIDVNVPAGRYLLGVSWARTSPGSSRYTLTFGP